MAPQLLFEQLAAGAWGFTIATTSQAIVLRTFGFKKLLLASQMVEPLAARWVAGELADPTVDILVLVDSVEGVAILDAALGEARTPRPLRVLVEIGSRGGRSGCRTLEQAEAVVAGVKGAANLEFAGVEAFEGLITGGSSSETLAAVSDFLARVRVLIEQLAAGGAFDNLRSVVISAGGSAYFDLVIRYLTGIDIGRPVQTILRSGCYVTHDHEMYELNSPLAARGGETERLQPAFEVWGAVWSRPEPKLAVVGMGKRDVPTDSLLPLALRLVSPDGAERDVTGQFKVTGFNDQHAYVEVPAEDPVRPGDRVVFGISHPCMAFDKWRLIPVVNDDYDVIDAIETYF